jgi:hypothetical protein
VYRKLLDKTAVDSIITVQRQEVEWRVEEELHLFGTTACGVPFCTPEKWLINANNAYGQFWVDRQFICIAM